LTTSFALQYDKNIVVLNTVERHVFRGKTAKHCGITRSCVLQSHVKWLMSNSHSMFWC